MTKPNYVQMRKYTRYKPDPGTVAFIDPEPDEHKDFTPTIPALVLSESYGGCGLIVLASDGLEKGDICQIRVGRLSPMDAEIVWAKKIDAEVCKVGVKFLI
jgi:hypothetical protein